MLSEAVEYRSEALKAFAERVISSQLPYQLPAPNSKTYAMLSKLQTPLT